MLKQVRLCDYPLHWSGNWLHDSYYPLHCSVAESFGHFIRLFFPWPRLHAPIIRLKAPASVLEAAMTRFLAPKSRLLAAITRCISPIHGCTALVSE